MRVIDTFIENCMRTESEIEFDTIPNQSYEHHIDLLRLIHASFGMNTEQAEFQDQLKKSIYYNKPLDKTNLKEELGDLLWYIAIACDALNTTIEIEMERVINKLKVRFPAKFNSTNAIHRDLAAERKALEE